MQVEHERERGRRRRREGRSAADFTVEAYPGPDASPGKVAQVRQAPITVQNVVTYDVVIGVDNDELALLPGMTANVRIVADERKDVLARAAPGAALRAGRRRATAIATPRAPARSSVWVLRDGAPVAVAVPVGHRRRQVGRRSRAASSPRATP